MSKIKDGEDDEFGSETTWEQCSKVVYPAAQELWECKDLPEAGEAGWESADFSSAFWALALRTLFLDKGLRCLERWDC